MGTGTHITPAIDHVAGDARRSWRSQWPDHGRSSAAAARQRTRGPASVRPGRGTESASLLLRARRLLRLVLLRLLDVLAALAFLCHRFPPSTVLRTLTRAAGSRAAAYSTRRYRSSPLSQARRCSQRRELDIFARGQGYGGNEAVSNQPSLSSEVTIPSRHVKLFGLLPLEKSSGLFASLLDDFRSYSRPW